MTLCCDRTARAAFAGMLTSLLTLLWSPVSAETESRSQEFEFDIPRTPRVMALYELSLQANGVLLGYLSNGPEEEETLVGPIKGQFTVEGVLRIILRSSMLTYRWVDTNMLSVEPLRLPPGSLNLNADGIIRTQPHSTEFDPEKVGIPEEVLVLGWPMRDLTLALSPVVVVEREQLDAIGAPTLPDALRYLSQSAYTRPEGYRTSGAQYAEMRGLGPDTALILINGRRALPSANSLTTSAFDLNTVPMPAVERIEFLLDSAAAAYGSDAIGGVINIVLRDRVFRPTFEARLGGADGGAKQERLTFSGGVNKDNFHGALVLDYFDLGGLLGGDRDLWRNQNFSRFGGRDRRTLESNPGNITALTGTLPGLTAAQASVPLVDTTEGVSREDFLSTAGQTNLESLLRFSSVVPEATRLTATASGTAQLNARLSASAELLYTDRESTYFFAPPVLPGMPVPASNAFNPFGTTVRAYRLLSSEYDSQYQFVESDLFRSVLALRGDWGTWDWEVSALHSEEEATTWLQNALDLQVAVPAALASSNAALALNPFSPAPVGSRALLDSLIAPRDVDQFSSEGTQVAAFVQGPIHEWRAGAVTTVIGGEWRNEAMSAANEASSFDRGRDVTAAFAQLRIPLVGEKLKIPLVHELTLTGGTRWDEYSDFGHVWRSQAGVLWKPHRDFSVRASGGRSFRPPSLYELYLPQISTIARVNDPARNELANITFTMGGNGDLRPSTAKSFTTGVLFSPDTAMNLKISADYWRVIMDERVLSLPLPVLLAHEDQFASRIHRSAPTQPGRPGILRSVDTSRINAGSAKATGVDLAIKADFLTSAGRFTPELQVTWFDDFLATDIPGQSALDRVDLASELGTILEWRAILGMRWKRGPFGVAAFARHTPSYDDAVAGVRTGHTIEAQTLLDLQGSLDLGLLLGTASPLHGVKLWLGATNLLDEAPNFAQVGDVGGFDTSQADLKQRSYYLRLDKKF